MRQPSKENPIKILRFADKRLWCFRGTMEEAWEFARKKRKRTGREMRRDHIAHQRQYRHMKTGGCTFSVHPPTITPTHDDRKKDGRCSGHPDNCLKCVRTLRLKPIIADLTPVGNG